MAENRVPYRKRVSGCKNAMDKTKEDRQSVYEIGYLLTTNVAEEKVTEEADKVRKIITDAGASVIAEETPHKERLAYTMRVKTVAGSYEKYDQAYFGWVKFELDSTTVESVKKYIEAMPTVLRMLLISTVRENTYLGKRAQAVAAAFGEKKATMAPEATKEAPATVEEMDKSIDEMVKEV